MKLVRKIIRAFLFPFIAPFLLIIASLIRQTSKIKMLLNDVDVRKKKQTDPKLITQMQYSRKTLLSMWGINDNEIEINNVKRGLLIESIFFTFIATLPVIGLWQDMRSIIYLIASLTTTPICLFVATTKIWRRECIMEGRLILYRDWLSGVKL